MPCRPVRLRELATFRSVQSALWKARRKEDVANDALRARCLWCDMSDEHARTCFFFRQINKSPDVPSQGEERKPVSIHSIGRFVNCHSQRMRVPLAHLAVMS